MGESTGKTSSWAGGEIRILFEDDALVAVAKPAGLPTANAARGAASAFTILQAARPAGSFLGVVSRLDAPVSGVLVFAKTSRAAAELARQFRDREIEKTYDAVVEGRFPASLGQWVDWHDRLERGPQERRSRLRPAAGADVRAAGDEAGLGEAPADGACHVRARVVKRLGEVSLVELAPTTGRRHQLRAQLAARGCPIVGDRTYGARLPFPAAAGTGPVIALHARSLGLAHPATGRAIVLAAEWPAAWRTRFPGLGRRPGS